MRLNENAGIGYRNAHSSYEGMDYCLREGYYASIVGKIEEKRKVNYNKIRIYRILIPKKNSAEQTLFMFSYLEPILDHHEVFKTVVQYVLAAGNIDETAKRLVVIRIRLGIGLISFTKPLIKKQLA